MTRVLLLLTSTAFLRAQQPLSFADADLRASAIFQQSAKTGMVLVVVRNRELMIDSYGETFPGSGSRPNSNSLLRLCSISKILATDLLLDLATEGKVALTDPLQRFAPPDTIVPTHADGTPITLWNLATHTSGLTREVSSYPKKIPHFTFPDQSFRWAWLPDQKLLVKPGTAAVYSNVAFDFLGDALASAAHQTYAELLNERLARPLHLRDTTLTPGSEQCGRLLRGARDEGLCTDTQASGPSGGVYSTASDMARVLQYFLRLDRPITADLKPEQLISHQGLSHAGDPTGIGLGWIQVGDPDSPSAIIQKTGGGAGFSTYIALNLKRQTGIFLAATEGTGHAEIGLLQAANDLLAALAGVPPIPPRVIPPKPHPVRKPVHPRVRPPATAATRKSRRI